MTHLPTIVLSVLLGSTQQGAGSPVHEFVESLAAGDTALADVRSIPAEVTESPDLVPALIAAIEADPRLLPGTFERNVAIQALSASRLESSISEELDAQAASLLCDAVLEDGIGAATKINVLFSFRTSWPLHHELINETILRALMSDDASLVSNTLASVASLSVPDPGPRSIQVNSVLLDLAVQPEATNPALWQSFVARDAEREDAWAVALAEWLDRPTFALRAGAAAAYFARLGTLEEGLHGFAQLPADAQLVLVSGMLQAVAVERGGTTSLTAPEAVAAADAVVVFLRSQDWSGALANRRIAPLAARVLIHDAVADAVHQEGAARLRQAVVASGDVELIAFVDRVLAQ